MLSPPLLNRMARFCWRSVRPTPTSRGCGASPAAKWSRVKAKAAGAGPRTAGGDGHHRPPGLLYASHQREVSGRRIHLDARWVLYFQGTLLAHYHTLQLRWCLPAQKPGLDLASRPIFLCCTPLSPSAPPFPSSRSVPPPRSSLLVK